jgi:hypothetical protein
VKTIFFLFAVFAVVPFGRAEEQYLKPNDVIALVGGEDMVVAGELGLLEANLQLALPDYHLKVRSLAWEGDTVYEQPRMLNYPRLEQQLDEIAATVIVMQFGQMEGMEGKARMPAFTEAYGKLIRRLNPEAKRRIVMVTPAPVFDSRARYGRRLVAEYKEGVVDLAKQLSGVRFAALPDWEMISSTRPDGRHLNALGQDGLAYVVSLSMEAPAPKVTQAENQALLSVISKKNRLWDRYRRPQNWAFLAGDRINQPSSRDHVDPTKRWFPEEMKEFVPLIEAREREIWDLAAKLAAEKK